MDRADVCSVPRAAATPQREGLAARDDEARCGRPIGAGLAKGTAVKGSGGTGHRSASTAHRPGHRELTDEAVIAASIKNPNLFTVLVERHSDRLFRYLQYRFRAQDADDALSALWETAFRRRSTFSPDRGTVVGWLYGIARNTVHHTRRGTAQRVRLMERLVATSRRLPANPSPEDEPSGVDRVLTAIRSLSDEDRENVELVVWEGLTYAQAAQAAGIAVGTVRSRLSRARHRLKLQLE